MIGQIERIRATLNGNDRLIGMWRVGTTGPLANVRKLAQAAAQAVLGFEQARGMVANDPRRTPLAQKEDIEAAGKQRLTELGRAVQKLHAEREKAAQEAAKLSAVKPYNGDAAQAAIDLAIGAHLRSMEPSQRAAALLSGTDRSLTDAVLRLPTALTGVSAEMRAQITRAAIERQYPDEAEAVADMAIALDDAAEALQRAFNIIATESGVDLAEQVKATPSHEVAADLVKTHPMALQEMSRKFHSEPEAA